MVLVGKEVENVKSLPMDRHADRQTKCDQKTSLYISVELKIGEGNIHYSISNNSL